MHVCSWDPKQSTSFCWGALLDLQAHRNAHTVSRIGGVAHQVPPSSGNDAALAGGGEDINHELL
jgi:hypothetical protein